ncbi:hypothetical protein MNAN1_001629 [Malassezia nana]|uniref:Kinesin-like protein n=1 Tax=Malassezia nana TaxID=180528 RepID=A0AAF0J221_9BASI|nr:hypothetical protein MNAN1_001629 [Malassezia nana]
MPVYGLDTEQEDLFQESVHPLVQRFLDGFNTTVFAYGQTSSGKSYSMGTSEESAHIPMDNLLTELDKRVGIIPRAAQQICAALSHLDNDGVEYKLSVSFLELYNEELIDLLSYPDEDRVPVQIRETREGDIVWMGLRRHVVHSAKDMVRLLQDGMAMRQTHETDMNAASSRSHAIFSVTLTQTRRPSQEGTPETLGRASPEKSSAFPRTPRSGLPTLSGRGPISWNPSPTRLQTPTRPQTPTQHARAGATPGLRAQDEVTVTTTSKLHFVDLAGSERLKRTSAVGERAKEGIAINSGLHALGNVISLLSDPIRSKRASYIPYRDSKLTRLLQDSLGGNAQTLMIACISTTEGNVSETLNTLQYAQRARRIRNTLERNQVETGWDKVEYLQDQVLRLRKELELVRSSNALVIASPQKSSASLPTEHEKEILSWQEKCTALSRKNVELTTELLQREREYRQAQQSTGDHDFLAAAEPVIMEYEKTVDGLESQINMLKAAVSYSEQVIHEQTEKIKTVTDWAETSERQLETLRETLRDLHERLEERNARIDGLEAQLRRIPSSQTDMNAAATLTLRRASLGMDTSERSFGGILDYKGRMPGQRTYRVTLHSRNASGPGSENADELPYTKEYGKSVTERSMSESVVQPMHPHNSQ